MPVPVVVFGLFLAFQEISTKQSPNAMKFFDEFLCTKRDPRRFGRRPDEPRGSDKITRCALGGAPLGLWAPHETS